MTLTNTYWNEKGKYQEISDKISDLMPTQGKTTNPYMNLFIQACKVYYDMYNNGGCNFKEDYFFEECQKYITPFADKLSGINFACKKETIYRNARNEEKLEKFIDSVVLFVCEQDLSYEQFTIYYSPRDKELSFRDHDDFYMEVFESREEADEWMNKRLKDGFKMV